MTVDEVIRAILKKAETEAVEDTVDTIKAGQGNTPVKGIVTTFIATVDVIKKARELGANLIITHEPTFYDHRDNITWQKGTTAYQYKRSLLEQSGIAVWRFHDNWHMTRPDGIVEGLEQALGWQNFAEKSEACVYNLPEITVDELAKSLKSKLGAGAVRYVGDGALKVKKAALLVGSYPAEFYWQVFKNVDFEVLICGETSEWMNCEYIRDTIQSGENKAMILLGHRNSEEEGMRYLAQWIKPLVPDIPVTFVPAGDPMTSV